MALLNCPECNEKVSDRANTCPHCGYVIKEMFFKPIETNKKIITGDASGFNFGAVVFSVGFIILQIGTYLYSWASSWLRTFLQYNVSSGYSRYLSKMSTGSTIMAFGAVVLIVGFIMCINAFRKGAITEKLYNFKWGTFSVILEIITFVVGFAGAFVLYEAWMNIYLFETSAVIAIAISVADIMIHKGIKRTSSVVAIVIGTIIVFLSLI